MGLEPILCFQVLLLKNLTSASAHIYKHSSCHQIASVAPAFHQQHMLHGDNDHKMMWLHSNCQKKFALNLYWNLGVIVEYCFQYLRILQFEYHRILALMGWDRRMQMNRKGSMPTTQWPCHSVHTLQSAAWLQCEGACLCHISQHIRGYNQPRYCLIKGSYSLHIH